MKLLLIEDDKVLSKNIKKSLETERFAVDSAETLENAHVAIEVNDYDCIILDIGLPDGSGFNLLEKLRGDDNKTPVVIVTARGEVDDRVKGLNLGADDYVPKPVDSTELVARIRAVIRRNASASLPIIKIGDLVVKPINHEAKVGKTILDLTAKEFSVLEYLALHHGEAVTRSMLMEHIWGSEFDTFSNVIDVYIKNLRKKIGALTKSSLITTIRGKGYVLKAK